MMTGTAPPSTDHAAPATSEACSEHRNTITEAISSGPARRRIGSPLAAASSTSLRVPPRTATVWSTRPPGSSHSSLATGPGATLAARRTLSFAHHRAGLSLERTGKTLDALAAYRSQHVITTWDETFERLLKEAAE